MGLVYQHWFAPDSWVRKETWTYCLDRYDQIRAVAQFRTGSHWLCIRTGRWQRTARSLRVCPCCSDKVEDELHLMECPLYEGLRQQFPDICQTPEGGWTDDNFRARMTFDTKQQWGDFANYLLGCKEIREGVLASAPRERT